MERTGLFRIFPMAPFLEYLRPFKGRLIVAMILMMFFGLLAPFQILMLVPTIRIILQSQMPKGTESAAAAGTPGDPASRVADEMAKTFQGSKPISDSKTDATEAEKAPAPPSLFGNVKAAWKRWWVAHLEPHKNRFLALAEQNPFSALMVIAVAVVIVTVVRGALRFVADYLLTYSLRLATINLQVEMVRRVLAQDFLYFKQKTTGYLLSRIASDMALIRNTSNDMLQDGFQQPFTVLALLAALLWLSPKMTLIALVMLPIIGIIFYVFGRRLRKITHKSRKESDKQSSSLTESLSNYHVIKLFGTEKREVDRFRRQSIRIFELNLKGRMIRFGASPLMEALGAIGVGAVLLLGSYYVLVLNSLDISRFIAYVICLTQFYIPIKKLSRVQVRFQEAFVSAERLLEILRLEPKIISPPKDPKPATFDREIALDAVSFTYGDDPVLQNISLSIPKGKIMALVGPTGAGKTTLMGLLPRLYDPTSGAIRLDGVDLREIDLEHLRKLFGVVTQETVLFNDTVLANIAYGADAVDRAKAEACARAANAHEFIVEMPKGYETMIGQGGSRLSGGQAQRVSIARALYRDPPILLLDEATSHLDSRTERLVQEAIDRLLEGRTVVVIAHRLSTVRRADRIVVLERGRVVEHGTHEELLEQVELYKNLYALQTGEP